MFCDAESLKCVHSGIALSFCRLSLSICIVFVYAVSPILYWSQSLYCIGVNQGPFTWGSQGRENRQTRQGTARGRGSVSNNLLRMTTPSSMAASRFKYNT